MLEGEWVGFVRIGFEKWLHEGNFGEAGETRELYVFSLSLSLGLLDPVRWYQRL